MSIYIGPDKLGPVVAVALDEAWGQRYGEHAAEELATEGKHIANAILRKYIVSLPEADTDLGCPELGGLPLNTILKVQWTTGAEVSVLRKTKERTPGHSNPHWECVSDNTGMVWAEWEIELVGRNVEIIALGTNHE